MGTDVCLGLLWRRLRSGGGERNGRGGLSRGYGRDPFLGRESPSLKVGSLDRPPNSRILNMGEPQKAIPNVWKPPGKCCSITCEKVARQEYLLKGQAVRVTTARSTSLQVQPEP